MVLPCAMWLRARKTSYAVISGVCIGICGLQATNKKRLLVMAAHHDEGSAWSSADIAKSGGLDSLANR